MNACYPISKPRKKKNRMALASTRADQSMPSYQDQAVMPLPQRDDLFVLEDVDPVIEMVLNSIGIRRFSDFDGYTPQSLSQVLRDRAGISISPNTIADWMGWAAIFAVEDDSEMKDGTLQIKKIRFVQIEMPATADTPSKQLLQGEMSFELADHKAFAETEDRTPLCAQIHAIDLATGESTLLASKAEYLPPDLIDYNVRLEFELPKEGRYQLQVVAFWLDADSIVGFYQGPILRVIS